MEPFFGTHGESSGGLGSKGGGVNKPLRRRRSFPHCISGNRKYHNLSNVEVSLKYLTCAAVLDIQSSPVPCGKKRKAILMLVVHRKMGRRASNGSQRDVPKEAGKGNRTQVQKSRKMMAVMGVKRVMALIGS